MEGLVIKDRDGKFDLSLAQSRSVSADARTWTFHLVQNATWNDGVPFTCADVKFTNDYMKSCNLTMGFVLTDVQSVDCPDDHTAVFNLKTSYSGFLDQISRTPGYYHLARTHMAEYHRSPALPGYRLYRYGAVCL